MYIFNIFIFIAKKLDLVHFYNIRKLKTTTEKSWQLLAEYFS
jgi:hypothetical protein